MFVNPKPSVVHQHMESMIAFHLNSHQRKLQIFVQGLDLVQRQDHPKPSINEVSVFLMKELMVQGGGGMWSFHSTSSNSVGIPRGVIHVNLGTFIMESLQIGSSHVHNVLDCGSTV